VRCPSLYRIFFNTEADEMMRMVTMNMDVLIISTRLNVDYRTQYYLEHMILITVR
jgi:hypothetical protein